MPSSNETKGFSNLFFDWLSKSLGISRELIRSLDRDDDWVFVIKMHGILEAGLNHLLLTYFGNPKFRTIVARLETSNDRSGKIAFIKAAGLLTDDACSFVKLFSKLRSHAVHDIKTFDLNLVKYFQSLNKTERHNWGIALTSWSFDKAPKSVRHLALSIPRRGIYNSCMGVILRCLEQHKAQEALLKEIEHGQSIPKE